MLFSITQEGHVHSQSNPCGVTGGKGYSRFQPIIALLLPLLWPMSFLSRHAGAGAVELQKRVCRLSANKLASVVGCCLSNYFDQAGLKESSHLLVKV